MMQEEVFHIPYQLPSGRTVYLRGKWDSVDVVGSGNKQRIVLQENKTKGEVVEEQLRKQLLFDLQSMYYLVALRAAGYKCEAIRYNVVRRPLSGGKGSIRQCKPTKSNPQGESKQEFYDRLAKIIAEEPEHFFMRWDVIVTYKDVCQFCNWFLDPCLEELCRWWDYIRAKPLNPWRNGNTLHWQYPYGIYNALAQGGSTEVDEYLATGSMLGLAKIDSLFRELTDVS